MGKKIIITKEQLKRLDEATIQIQSNDATIGGIGNAISNNKTQIDAAGNATPDGVDVMVSTPKSREGLPPQVVNVKQGENPADAANKQLDAYYSNSGAPTLFKGVGIGGVDNSVSEMKHYTKKQIEEERRRRRLNENYNTYTKKQISEGFNDNGAINNLDDIKESIRSQFSNIIYRLNEMVKSYNEDYEATIRDLDLFTETITEVLDKFNIPIQNVKYGNPYNGAFTITYSVDSISDDAYWEISDNLKRSDGLVTCSIGSNDIELEVEVDMPNLNSD